MSAANSFRLPLAAYPKMNPFVLDWLEGNANATRFLPRRTESPRVSPAAVTPHRAELAAALKASNRRWGVFTGDALDRWASGGTVTLIAGQQVGFAGGPLYTLAKLATLIRMKRDLEAQGTPVTAFFWLATEDHDFEEVATLNVPVSLAGNSSDVNRQLDLLCIRAVRPADGRSAVGSLPIPSVLIDNILSLFDIDRPSWLREGVTFGDSFAELIATVSGGEVVLVDALLPELRRAGQPLFEQIARRGGEIQEAIGRRSREIGDAGYSQQVLPREADEYTLLFELDDADVRRPFAGGTLPPAERVSTSALTRPLLQDYVLRPDVFVGGPAEVAYYAQIAPLHDLLGVTMPRVALRGHALVVPGRAARAIGRYALDPVRLFAPADEVLREEEPEALQHIHAITDRAKLDLFSRIEEINQLALPADHSLARSIQRSIGHLEYHFDKLAERASKAVVRKDRERYAATRELVATLFPDGHVQDRVVSWFAWWSHYGQHLVDRIVEEIEPDAASFKIVTI